MSRKQVLSQLNEIFKEVFDDEAITVTDDTTANDIDGWDSLMHIDLLFAVENKFGIQFEMDEGLKMRTVGEMADSILKKIGEFDK